MLSAYLDDKNDNGVLRIIERWIRAFQDPALRSCSTCAGSSRRGDRHRLGDRISYSSSHDCGMVFVGPPRLEAGRDIKDVLS